MKNKERNPGIYIGIGGAGIRTLIKLKAMILEEYNNDFTSFKNQNKFIFIDTNPHDYESILNDNSLIEIFKGKPIEDNEFLNITETYYYPPLDFKSISKDTHWYEVQSDRNSTLPNSRPLSRMEVRFALLYNLKVVDDAIISAVFSSEVVPTLHVIAGSCGNTGSAIALDIIQLLIEHANRRFSRAIDRYIDANLTLLAPQTFIRLKHEKRLELNAFATFWEINAFCSLENDQTSLFNLTGKKEYKPELFIQLIDAENTLGKFLELNDFYEHAAAVVNRMGEFIVYWGMGEWIHPMVAHRIFKATDENLEDAFRGKILNKNEWHPIVFSGVNLSFEYPITQFQKYTKLRFKDELLNKYLLGMPFNSILIDKHITIKSYLKEIMSCLQDNIRILIINKILEKVELRDHVIEKNRFLGFSIGFKKNAFIQKWTTVKIEVAKQISDIKQTYLQETSLIKVEIIRKIKENINQVLNDLVLNYGCQYAYDVFQQLADALDSSEGQEYLEHLNLLNINDELKIIESKIKVLDSTIEIQARENKDEVNFLLAIERYTYLQIDYLYLEIVKELIQTIMIDPSNIIGTFKNSSDQEFNLFETIEKLKIEARQATIDYNNLIEEFRNTKHPLIIYSPDLNTMIDGFDWKTGSDFDLAYCEIIQRVCPHSNDNSSFWHVIFDFIGNNLKFDLQDTSKNNFFRDVFMKSESPKFLDTLSVNAAFFENEFQKKIIDDLINNKVIIDDLFSICLDAILDKSDYRHRRYTQMNISEIISKMSQNPEQKSVWNDLRSSFLNLTDFFSFDKEVEDLTLMQLYYSSEENGRFLKDYIWPQFGFEDNRFSLTRANNKDFSTSKTIFRLGYAFNDYKYFKVYESAINDIITQNRLFDYKGCFTNKYFLKLDIDEVIQDVSMDNGKNIE
jgi:hypothetical protein